MTYLSMNQKRLPPMTNPEPGRHLVHILTF
jgi:hypothetical protein